MNSKLQPPTKTEDIFKVHIADLSDKHKESSPPRASTRKAPARSSNRYEPYNKPPAKTKQTESKPAKVASKPTKVASKPAKPTAKAASKPAPKKTEEPPAKKTKRAAWDTKGRLEDLEQSASQTHGKLIESEKIVSDMSLDLAASKEKIKEIESLKINLEKEVTTKLYESSHLSDELANLKSKFDAQLETHEVELKSMNAKHSSIVEDLNIKIESLIRKNKILTESEEILTLETAHLKSTISKMSVDNLSLESQFAALKIQNTESLAKIQSQALQISENTETISSKNIVIEALECKIRNEEAIRRSLHNTIQELKGNIRVFCRIRPPLASEPTGTSHMQLSENNIELIQSLDSATGKSISKSYPFSFDKVFSNEDQETVFEEISQLVQSALDGYNVCVFAYGQTGSGKTFTMEGNSDNIGMIPRAVLQIYNTAQKLSEKGWKFQISAQFLEIYNETVKDLLCDAVSEADLKITHGRDGKTTVANSIVVEVTNPDQVSEVLKTASKNRAVAATNCNERSSRSHSVFMLTIVGENSVTGEKTSAVLNLIDLAGSERLSSSGSSGDRLKETQAINKSLSSLGDVISALAEKSQHVPYRNSKLTYLLQNSLGGNSKTLMFVNLSPLESSLGESLCSLRFATKVNSCQIGTARKATK